MATVFEFYKVTVEGTLPLLMARFDIDMLGDEESAKGAKRVVQTKVSKLTRREQAERLAYYIPGTRELCLPTGAFIRALRDAGSNHKMTGSRKSAKYAIAPAVLAMTEWARLHDRDGEAYTQYEIDSRGAVNQVSKGRIAVHRPRLDQWRATFEIRLNSSLISEQFVQSLLVEAGMTLGVGAYRAGLGGPFGLFNVIHFDQRDAVLADAAE